MSREETMNTIYGEMRDMITCLSIYNGSAEPKAIKRKKTFEEVMRMK